MCESIWRWEKCLHPQVLRPGDFLKGHVQLRMGKAPQSPATPWSTRSLMLGLWHPRNSKKLVGIQPGISAAHPFFKGPGHFEPDVRERHSDVGLWYTRPSKSRCAVGAVEVIPM